MSVLTAWLSRQGEAALRRRDLRPEQRRALHAIRRCRTPAFGGQCYRCAHCGGEHHGIYSCHHRACPRCGGEKTVAWTHKQVERLLPVPYFFGTCTVPEALRGGVAGRGGDPAPPRRRAGDARRAPPPCGRQVQHHPHIHSLLPGGGLRADHRKWRKTRRPDYLIPNESIAAALRRRMLVECLLEKAIVVREKPEPPPRWHLRCPHCERFTLVVVAKLLPIHAPS